MKRLWPWLRCVVGARGFPAAVILVVAATSIPSHRDKIVGATERSARSWQTWRQNHTACRYYEPRMEAQREFLREQVRPGERIMFMPDPKPCSPAYAAYLQAAYVLCPTRLLLPGGELVPTRADALYFHMDHEDVILGILSRRAIPRPPIQIKSPGGPTLFRWK